MCGGGDPINASAFGIFRGGNRVRGAPQKKSRGSRRARGPSTGRRSGPGLPLGPQAWSPGREKNRQVWIRDSRRRAGSDPPPIHHIRAALINAVPGFFHSGSAFSFRGICRARIRGRGARTGADHECRLWPAVPSYAVSFASCCMSRPGGWEPFVIPASSARRSILPRRGGPSGASSSCAARHSGTRWAGFAPCPPRRSSAAPAPRGRVGTPRDLNARRESPARSSGSFHLRGGAPHATYAASETARSQRLQTRGTSGRRKSCRGCRNVPEGAALVRMRVPRNAVQE